MNYYDDGDLGHLPEPYTRQWINAPYSERLLFTEDQMRSYAAAERERAVLAFADFLHRLPDEKGRSVGPAMLLFDCGMLTSALWATSDDTKRWARMFLGPNVRIEPQP